jgi:hypothetical protein
MRAARYRSELHQEDSNPLKERAKLVERLLDSLDNLPEKRQKRFGLMWRSVVLVPVLLSLVACATCNSSDSTEVCRTKQRNHGQPRP